MYTWQIDIWLKNGEKIKARYKGDENASDKVAIKLFNNRADNNWITLLGELDSHQVLVKIGEIAAIDIYYLA